MTEPRPERRSTDPVLEKILGEIQGYHADVIFIQSVQKDEAKRTDALEAGLGALKVSLDGISRRIDDIVHAPLKFAAWAVGLVFIAFFGAIGVKIYQLFGHLCEAIKKVW